MDKRKQNTPEATEQPERTETEQRSETSLGMRIFAWVLAIIVIIGLILYYYYLFNAGR